MNRHKHARFPFCLAGMANRNTPIRRIAQFLRSLGERTAPDRAAPARDDERIGSFKDCRHRPLRNPQGYCFAGRGSSHAPTDQKRNPARLARTREARTGVA